MRQITFPVILLFAFRKCERSVALRTRDFEVFHRGFSTRGNRGRSPSLLFGALASRFFHPRSYGAKALFLKHYAEKLRVPTVNWRECTPANHSIQTICVAEDRQEIPDVWRPCHTTRSKSLINNRHMGCS